MKFYHPLIVYIYILFLEKFLSSRLCIISVLFRFNEHSAALSKARVPIANHSKFLNGTKRNQRDYAREGRHQLKEKNTAKKKNRRNK